MKIYRYYSLEFRLLFYCIKKLKLDLVFLSILFDAVIILHEGQVHVLNGLVML